MAWWRDRLGGIGDEAALDMGEQIAIHQKLGWRQLELRTVDGIALGDLPEPHIRKLADSISAADLVVSCLDSRIGNWARPITRPLADDIAELTALAAVSALLGTPYVRVMSYPNDGLSAAEWRAETLRRFAVLSQLAIDLDLVLLLENCSGWAGTSAEHAVELLSTVEGIGMLFDIGNPVAHGYDGPAYLAEVVRYVRHVHVKDARTTNGAAVFTPPGAGTAALADCVRTLLANGYDGVFSIEPHVAVVPHTGQRADPDTVRAAYLDYARALETLLADIAVPARTTPSA